MTADAGGPYTVTVTAADGMGASAHQTFTWNSTNLRLDNPGDQTYAAGQTVNLAIHADDNDGNRVDVHRHRLAAGLSLSMGSMTNAVTSSTANANTTSGPRIVGAINPSDLLAAYHVTLNVADVLGLTATVHFVITVESYTVTFSPSPVITGYLIVNGAPVNLPDPAVAYAVVSDISRLPNIQFSVAGPHPDRISLGQIHRSNICPMFQ